MSASENAELARRGYEAFGAGDLDAVTALFTDDIVWHIPGSSPIAGDYRGTGEVMGFFGRLFELSGGTFQLTVHDVLASDDHVVALVHETGAREGRHLDQDGAHVWHVRDGKLSEFWGVPVDAAAGEAFWA